MNKSVVLVVAGLAVLASGILAADELPQVALRTATQSANNLQDTSSRAPVPTGAEVLVELRERGRREVDALAAQLKNTVDPTERLALQRKIQAVKRAQRLARLEAILALAEARNDAATAEEARRILEAMTNPPQPAVDVQRGAPRAAERGGR